MDKYGYIPIFGNEKVDLWFNSQSIGSCFLFYYLCRLCLAPSSVDYSLNVERFVLKDLWLEKSHLYYGIKGWGISLKKKVEKLIKDEILLPLYFQDPETYVDCIIGNWQILRNMDQPKVKSF